jgi:hypothetical protein
VHNFGCRHGQSDCRAHHEKPQLWQKILIFPAMSLLVIALRNILMHGISAPIKRLLPQATGRCTAGGSNARSGKQRQADEPEIDENFDDEMMRMLPISVPCSRMGNWRFRSQRRGDRARSARLLSSILGAPSAHPHPC